MNQVDEATSITEDVDGSAASAGISLRMTLLALVVLAAVVAALFWGLPRWFGDSVINVIVR